MDRCPNCGAPARPGAKFCTTCGYRLPVTAPVTSPSDSGDTSATGTASSWPPPPTAASERAPDEQPQAETVTVTSQSTADEVIAAPTPTAAGDASEPAAETTGSEATAPASSTDSLLSSSWPSPSPTSHPYPWTARDTPGDEPSDTAATGAEPDGGADESQETAVIGVSAETVVVDEPASQYEGWSSAVVEEVIPPASGQGTTIARATALLDELRLLLPVLNAGAGTDLSAAVADELEAALGGAAPTPSDREGLRAALNEARDHPRDIQTILALSQQADAAIALLDDYDKLADAVQRAINALRPDSSAG